MSRRIAWNYTNIGEGGAIKGVFLRREILEPVDLSKEGGGSGQVFNIDKYKGIQVGTWNGQGRTYQVQFSNNLLKFGIH